MCGTFRARSHSAAGAQADRRGAASLDYVLVLGVILPLVAVILPLGRRIVQLVYEMMVVFVAWPFL